MRPTPVVATILALCAIVFFLELGTGTLGIDWLALWPLGLFDTASFANSHFYPWQIVSYAFVQGGFLHLALNLYALWLLGIPLERRWGSCALESTISPVCLALR